MGVQGEAGRVTGLGKMVLQLKLVLPSGPSSLLSLKYGWRVVWLVAGRHRERVPVVGETIKEDTILNRFFRLLPQNYSL